MKRWWRVALLAPLAGMCLLALVVVAVLRSDWLRERVRTGIIETVEKATNARTEIGAFEYDWRRMSAKVAPFVLHGTEAAGQPPLFRAESITLRFTVLSMVSRQVRLDALTIEKPEIHITADAQGRTNLPPRRATKEEKNAVQELLRIGVRRLECRKGTFEFDRGSIPVDLRAEDFEAGLDWEARGQLYRGRVAARKVRLNEQFEASVDTSVVVEANQVRFENARIARGSSSVTATGSIRDWKEPVAEAAFEGDVLLADVPGLRLPPGRVTLSGGRVSWNKRENWTVAGIADARGLVFEVAAVRLTDVRARTLFRAKPERVELSGLSVQLLDGTWRGKAELDRWRDFRLEGDAAGFPVERLQGLFGNPVAGWNGTLGGPISAEGQIGNSGVTNTQVRGIVSVEPAPGAVPISGNIDFEFRQAERTVRLGASRLETPGARMNFNGTLGERLNVGLTVTRIEDLEPVLGLFRPGSAFKIPAHLDRGEARFEGTVTGDWAAARIDGNLDVRNVVIGEIKLDRFEADVHAAPDRFVVRNAHVFREGERGGGEVELALSNWTWQETLPMKARIRLEKADLARMAGMAGLANPPRGSLSGEATWEGALDHPRMTLDLTGGDIAWAGEQVKALELKLNYSDAGQGRLQGSVRMDLATVEIDGVYRHPTGQFDRGAAELQLAAKNLSIAEIETLQALRPGLTGVVDWNAKMQVDVAGWRPAVHSLEGAFHVRDLAQPSGPIGPLELNAWTENDLLRLQARIELQGRPVQGVGQVKLTGDYPAQAKLVVPILPFSLVRNLLAKEPVTERSQVQGVVEGEITVQAPLAHLERITGRAVLSRLVVRPREASIGETALDVTDLTLRNNGPLVFDIDEKGVHVKSARFAAKETDLALSGDFSLGDRSPWNLTAKGSVDLAVLSTFKPELQASGASTLNATLRGRLDDPQLSGRMDIRQASLFLRNVPNGVEQANATVLFDRNRANIERLSGQTGGGSFDVAGFVGFSGSEFTYRLQANLNKVRVRYPEGVSTTLNAAVSLTGTSARSLLAGTVTILRSGFNMQSDLATLISQSSQPNTAAAMQNEFLQGMQFDVRIRTSANAEFQTSYTKDVQTEADLRMRGSLAKPILLGRVKINRGEVDFLGTKYTISRGEVIFYNAASLQPAVDLDLETRVRGINVLVNFAGPINKLNVSYRSDPPLMSNEILALLAVGRTPESMQTSLGSSQTLQNQTNTPGGGSALLGGALSASVNGRLERFFGASRIKIDPTITGVDNIPQARLTIEQSVSRNITATFVTNLNRTQQQIWRLEWDLSREWSVVAVRDENGLFGIDFLVRKRFK